MTKNDTSCLLKSYHPDFSTRIRQYGKVEFTVFFVMQCTGQILEAYNENVFIVFADKTTRMFRIQ